MAAFKSGTEIFRKIPYKSGYFKKGTDVAIGVKFPLTKNVKLTKPFESIDKAAKPYVFVL